MRRFDVTNSAYRAMVRGKESDKSPEELWEEIQETTMQLDWDVEHMLESVERNAPIRDEE